MGSYDMKTYVLDMDVREEGREEGMIQTLLDGKSKVELSAIARLNLA